MCPANVPLEFRNSSRLNMVCYCADVLNTKSAVEKENEVIEEVDHVGKWFESCIDERSIWRITDVYGGKTY